MLSSTQASAPVWADASLTDLLAIAHKKYRVVFEQVNAGGVTLQIAQIANMRKVIAPLVRNQNLDKALTALPLWAKIWPASVLLGHYLERYSPAGRTVLEAGAGCGVSGLVAAALGAQVWLTDNNDEALLFARINALKNNLGARVTVCRADIVTDTLPQQFSLILGSEILYLESLYTPLVAFFRRHLCAEGAHCPEVLLASDHRRDPKAFFDLAADFFSIAHSRIGLRAKHEQAGERHLITLHKLSSKEYPG